MRHLPGQKFCFFLVDRLQVDNRILEHTSMDAVIQSLATSLTYIKLSMINGWYTGDCPANPSYGTTMVARSCVTCVDGSCSFNLRLRFIQTTDVYLYVSTALKTHTSFSSGARIHRLGSDKPTIPDPVPKHNFIRQKTIGMFP